MAEFIKAAERSQVASGTGMCVVVNGKKIALFNLDGTFHAIDDTCTHRGGPLSEGELDGDQVVCPWHGAAFNLKTGKPAGPPAPGPVGCYKVRVQGDTVEIEV